MNVDDGAERPDNSDDGSREEPSDRTPGPAPEASPKPQPETPPEEAEVVQARRHQAELPQEPRTPLTQQIGRATIVALAVLFGVFAVANSQHVAFSWVFGATEVVTDADGERLSGGVPLIALLVASFAAGALIGSVAAWQAGRSRRAREPQASSRRRRKG